MLHEGDLVTCGNAAGVVVEDRGPIGMNGRRLYAVRFDDEWCIELPAEMLRKQKRRG
jgi:hypothetical protein